MISAPLRSLLANLVDYAGLFPPARLDMEAAVAEFAAQKQSAQAWMLGRFVVPAGRLQEFAAARGGFDDRPWDLSVLVSDDVEGDRALLDAFALASPNLARVAAVEHKPDGPAGVGRAHAVLHDLDIFFELPYDSDPAATMAAVSAMNGRGAHRAVKIRTGGITPEAIPSVSEVARFLAAARDAGLAFKATAGLHHALRGDQALTYEDDAPRAAMHGFLNVFMAAAALHSGRLGRDSVEELLEESDAASFLISRRGIVWHEREISALAIAATRESFAMSYGSCSFAEPVQELQALGWL